MTPTVTESTTTVRERAADALRHAAHLSHEAHVLKTLASDAIEDGLHTARRSVKKARQRALDTRDDLTYRIKRQPLMAVAVAFSAGALLGLVLGWTRRSGGRRDEDAS